MQKIRIGITGQNGFIGQHLSNVLKLSAEKYELVPFDRVFFSNSRELELFVSKCDTIIHLAAINRHDNEQTIYDTNINLVKSLISALENTNSKAQIIFSSSTQEEKDNMYGKSKIIGRQMLSAWARESSGKFVGMVIPNVFGPFGKPFYNSFVSTFCHQLIQGELPEIKNDAEIGTIYVGDLVNEVLSLIDNQTSQDNLNILATTHIKVSSVFAKLVNFKNDYFNNGMIPYMDSKFDIHLFNTFRSYIKLESFFPRKYVNHVDDRGNFVELIKSQTGGQVSFSTTLPGVTRGNHFHLRKIERFSVIKGKALLKLRKVGSDHIHEFFLDGDNPSYVDMPIWYAHNIKNVGDSELFTIFWINEPYNADDPDTFIDII